MTGGGEGGEEEWGEWGEEEAPAKKAKIKAEALAREGGVCDEGGGEVEVTLEYVHERQDICNGQSCDVNICLLVNLPCMYVVSQVNDKNWCKLKARANRERWKSSPRGCLPPSPSSSWVGLQEEARRCFPSPSSDPTSTPGGAKRREFEVQSKIHLRFLVLNGRGFSCSPESSPMSDSSSSSNPPTSTA